MEMAVWHLVFTSLLISVSWVRGHNISTCDSIINIKCDTYHIIIKALNTNSTVAPSILEHCNGKETCGVVNEGDECVTVFYSCRKSPRLNVEIADSNKIQQNNPSMSLLSRNYDKGEYEDARNIECYLKSNEAINGTSHSSTSKTLLVMLNEFAPFSNSKDYCFKVNEQEQSLVCSGSQTMYNQRYINSMHGWNISMKLADTANHVPKIRFWIRVEVVPKDDAKYELKCHSHPVTGETSDGHNLKPNAKSYNTATIISTTVTIALGVCLIGAALLCRHKFKKARHQSILLTKNDSQSDAENPYTYVDIGHMELMKDISSPSPATILGGTAFSLSSMFLLDSKFKDRTLPRPPSPTQSQVQANCSLLVLPIHPGPKNGDAENDDLGYLEPKTLAKAKEAMEKAKEAVEEASDETESATEDTSRANSEHVTLGDVDECSAENSYAGIDQKVLAEEKNLRSSVHALYTLLPNTSSTDDASEEDIGKDDYLQATTSIEIKHGEAHETTL